MKRERWKKRDELLDEALELPPERRVAFLDEACAGDEQLRKELDESLASEHATRSFLEQPALEVATTALTDKRDSMLGQIIGHYKIISLLGEGGMGQVYLAEDGKLNRRVAIKFLPGHWADNDEANERLLREARAAAKLDHPNICAVHEAAEENGRSFIVMPYVHGETLEARMKRQPLQLSETLAIAHQIADALAEAHAHGIIHRDVKPANIIITPRGHAKVMDFGLAKLSPIAGSDGLKVDAEASTQALLTTPGTIIGTVPYMSPEQLHGQQLDARTDIFSFGIVLYEMVTGQRPFAAQTPAGIISAILTKEPPSVSDYVLGCPSELERIVAKCLEKVCERRYQTMSDVKLDIESVGGQGASGSTLRRNKEVSKEVTASHESLKKRRRFASPVWVALTAVAAVAIMVLLYAVFFRSSRNAPTSGDRTVNSPAYNYYLRGKVNAGSENREANESAIKFLEQAVAADPNFAPAYAELAEAYGIQSFYFASGTEKKTLNENAEVALEKALALNPDLAEGHSARGLLLWTHDYRFPHEQAIQSFKRALALNPNLDKAHHRLGVVYLHIGLLDKAWEEIEKALADNPANTLARFRFGVIDMYRGKYEDALSVFKAIPHEANPSLVDRQMATALFQLGRTQEASEVVEEYLRTYPTDEGGTVTSVKAMLLARTGREREAEETIKRAVEIGRGFGHFHHTAYNIACAYALLNKADEALKWLQFTADDGFPCYPLFENDANLNNLRKDQRFIAFMARLKQQWERYLSTL